ncbi:MAG TPA: TetR/AcrR family transcriptional regulator [Candidatus Sulfotelmatobacter sp.]|nr:TetR/AcrR family transcriptional regulator [Candidatus Sulfotelmatobacter sp.]
MRYDTEHKERTRNRVLREAAKAIRSKGPHRIGVAEVMARAGLTHGGFYAHFSSKDELVIAAVAQMFDEAMVNYGRLAAGKAPAAALCAYIDFYLSPRHRDARDAGCPLPALSADLPRLGAPARRRFAQGVAALTAGLADRLARLGRADAEALAASALAEMAGALALARGVADAKQSNAILTHSRDSVKRRLGLAGADA